MSGPLAGRRIVLTRRAEDAAALGATLESLGATVVVAPTVEILPAEDDGPLRTALSSLAAFHWIVFTSGNACRAVRGVVERLPGALSIATVGPATTAAVRAAFPRATVDLEPASDFRAEGLLRAFDAVDVAARRLLLPLSDRARPLLADGLRSRGGDVTTVTAYRTVAAPGAAEGDLVVFASPSAVFGWAGPERPAAAVLGPTTEAAARAAGFPVAVVATPSTADGLVDGITSWAAALSATSSRSTPR